jgi:Methyltransferase domain
MPVPASWSEDLLESIAMIVDRALYRHPAEMYPPSDERQSRPFDYERMARVLAAVDAARFLEEHFSSARNLVGQQNLLRHACRSARVVGDVLEFGVRSGQTLTVLCEEFDQETVHGFDSFQGLPEDWRHDRPAGTFSTGGVLPTDIPPNATLHVGMFEDTIHEYLKQGDRPVSFVHVDSDLYSSARTVLCALAERFRPGSIVVFDEFLNYPGWRQHEYKAFNEFVEAFDVRFSYMSFASSYMSVAVRLESIPHAG